MVSIKLKFRPSTIDGKEGSLYYQVIYKRVVRQIATHYKIMPNEWNAESDTLRIIDNNERYNYLHNQGVVDCTIRVWHNLETNKIIADIVW